MVGFCFSLCHHLPKSIHSICVSVLTLFFLADFIPPTENGSSSISVGVVVGIVAGVILLVFLLIGILWWRDCLRRKDTLEQGIDYEKICLSKHLIVDVVAVDWFAGIHAKTWYLIRVDFSGCRRYSYNPSKSFSNY